MRACPADPFAVAVTFPPEILIFALLLMAEPFPHSAVTFPPAMLIVDEDLIAQRVPVL